jgi:hypothetical protein
MKGAAITGIIIVAWRMRWLHRAAHGIRSWLYELGWFEPAPEQRTLDEYARDLDFEDGLNVAEAIDYLSVVGGCCIRCQRLDATEPCRGCYCHEEYPAETQPFQAFHDDAPPVAMPALVLDDGSFAGLSGTRRTDMPRPGQLPDHGPAVTRGGTGPGQPRPFHPHAGPPAWRADVYTPVTGRWHDPQDGWWTRCGATGRRDWMQSAWDQIMMAADGPRQLTA